MFFVNDPAPTDIYTLSLHDALPILVSTPGVPGRGTTRKSACSDGDECRYGWPDDRRCGRGLNGDSYAAFPYHHGRSEEHTSELQSRPHLVCRLLLEKKKFHVPTI